MRYKKLILKCPMCNCENMFEIDRDKLLCEMCGSRSSGHAFNTYETLVCEMCGSRNFQETDRDRGIISVTCTACDTPYKLPPLSKSFQRIVGSLIRPEESEVGKTIMNNMGYDPDVKSTIDALMSGEVYMPDHPNGDDLGMAVPWGIQRAKPAPTAPANTNSQALQTGKYIFISYAHRDSHVVLPLISALQRNGYSVWYDQGIEAGTEWPEYIAERIANCGVFLTCLSPAAVQSQNCRNEINFALSLKKDCLSVYLEETHMTLGMQLQLGSIQALFKHRHTTDASFYQALIAAPLLLKIKH